MHFLINLRSLFIKLTTVRFKCVIIVYILHRLWLNELRFTLWNVVQYWEIVCLLLLLLSQWWLSHLWRSLIKRRVCQFVSSCGFCFILFISRFFLFFINCIPLTDRELFHTLFRWWFNRRLGTLQNSILIIVIKIIWWHVDILTIL